VVIAPNGTAVLAGETMGNLPGESASGDDDGYVLELQP
jgi:hypothetical protein